MGDFKKNKSMQEIEEERKSRVEGTATKDTIRSLSGNNEKKDKAITAKVYPEMWVKFTKINRAQGITNNSAINMILSAYVREHEDLL